MRARLLGVWGLEAFELASGLRGVVDPGDALWLDEPQLGHLLVSVELRCGAACLERFASHRYTAFTLPDAPRTDTPLRDAVLAAVESELLPSGLLEKGEEGFAEAYRTLAGLAEDGDPDARKALLSAVDVYESGDWMLARVARGIAEYFECLASMKSRNACLGLLPSPAVRVAVASYTGDALFYELLPAETCAMTPEYSRRTAWELLRQLSVRLPDVFLYAGPPCLRASIEASRRRLTVYDLAAGAAEVVCPRGLSGRDAYKCLSGLLSEQTR